MTVNSQFASEVLRARREQNRTQAWVAERADTSIRWYQSIESGKVCPSFKVGIRIAIALNIDLNQLIRDVFGEGHE